MHKCIFSLVTAIALVVTGCSKPSEKTAVSSGNTTTVDKVLAVDLVKKLPTSAVGFVVWDFTGAAFAKFKSSPGVKGTHTSSLFDKFLDGVKSGSGSEGDAKVFTAVIELAKSFGLINPSGDIAVDKTISQALAFGDLPVSGKLEDGSVALLLAGASGTNLQDKLPAIENVFKQAGLQFTSTSVVDGTKGLTVTLTTTPTEGAPTNAQLYVSASDKLLGISLKTDTLKKLFSNEEPNGITVLKTAPEFERATKAVAADEDGMAFGYISLARLLPVMKVLEQQAQATGESGSLKPEENPVQAAAFFIGAGQVLTQQVAVVTDPKTDMQRTVLKALEGSKAPNITSSLPTDTAMAVGFDVGVLTKTDSLMAQLKANDATKDFVETIKNIKGATIAFRNNDAGSPFPDVFVQLDTANRDQVMSTIKTAVGAAGDSMPMSKWQDKDISGAQSSFFTTPLGVGMYLAKPAASSSTLLIASSERAVKDAVAAATANSSAAQGLAQQRISTDPGFFSYRINFTELSNVVDSVKGNLAMFMGGSDEVEKQLSTTELRLLGPQAGLMAYKDGVIHFSSFQEIKPQPPQG